MTIRREREKPQEIEGKIIFFLRDRKPDDAYQKMRNVKNVSTPSFPATQKKWIVSLFVFSALRVSYIEPLFI